MSTSLWFIVNQNQSNFQLENYNLTHGQSSEPIQTQSGYICWADLEGFWGFNLIPKFLKKTTRWLGLQHADLALRTPISNGISFKISLGRMLWTFLQGSASLVCISTILLKNCVWAPSDLTGKKCGKMCKSITYWFGFTSGLTACCKFF